MPSRINSLHKVAFFALLALPVGPCAGQTASVESIHKLYDQKQYSEIVRLVPRSAANPPELDLYLGLAFAQLRCFSEANAALKDGERKNPQEERFPVELAGVAYRRNDLAEAARDLRRAIRLDPHDSYALNFLGTLYLLRGNLPAAVKYWNRIGAPRISQIEESPQPRVKRALLDRAVTVSPLSVMRLRDFETTDAEIGALGIFSIRHWELQPDGPDIYNLVLHSFEDDGWGASKWTAALSMLRGLPYE
ncbi:MAG TPA: tetratricopeptide repeat protein, partial [Candidatus Acidoferrales bacterium]|nr:tetratricopeptide repeat protein [Candidatus Acidoferrales bacterium]